MRGAGIGGGRIEVGLIRRPGLLRVAHRVVDVENYALCAIFAVFGLVFALHDGERVQNIGGIVAGDAVEMKIGGVQFAAQQKAAFVVPAERRAVIAAIPRKRR